MQTRVSIAFLLSASLVHAFLPSPSLCGIRQPGLHAGGRSATAGCHRPLSSAGFTSNVRRHKFSSETAARGRSTLGLSSLSATDSSPESGSMYDVVIIGSGPASLSLASLLTSSTPNPPSVVVCSKDLQKQWVPNYGVWVAEWEALDAMYRARNVEGMMQGGVDIRWEDTDCFFGEDASGSPTTNPEGNQRRSLKRPYIRVSRSGLKSVFYNENSKYKVIEQNVMGKVIGTNMFSPADAMSFHETHTTLTLTDGSKVHGKVVIDGTGAESRFTIRDDREKEGYQIAYGVECSVKGPGLKEGFVGDYDISKMTLFDYRSEAWRDQLPDPAKILNTPTFNYVMPLSKDKFFFEETSLVAAPAVRFQECKDRLRARLASQGITVDQIYDEEFCYIPMGGAVPRRGQRIVPIGAAAGVVHPSTGYQICRCLSSNCDVSDAVLRELAADQFDPDAASARVLGSIWTPDAMRQRDFAVFGGEFLMNLDVDGLKGFFSGFFKLGEPDWSGFLAGWKNLPGNDKHATWTARLLFGLRFLTKLPPSIGAKMAVAVAKYTLAEGIPLLQSVTPLFGAPLPFEAERRFVTARVGDTAAKEEAAVLCGQECCPPPDAAQPSTEPDAVPEPEEEKAPAA